MLEKNGILKHALQGKFTDLFKTCMVLQMVNLFTG